jgi:hypothetical protein
MALDFFKASAGAVVVAATLLAGGSAIAQEDDLGDAPELVEIQPLDQAFLDAFYTRGGNFFENRRFPTAFTWFLGPFPENDILADGEAVHELYVLASQLQNESDPYLRTADLVNPFDTSLLLLPPYQPEPVPPAEPFFLPPPVSTTPAAPAEPVPALW